MSFTKLKICWRAVNFISLYIISFKKIKQPFTKLDIDLQKIVKFQDILTKDVSGVHVMFKFYQIFSEVHVKFKFYQVFSGDYVKLRYYQDFSGGHVKFKFYQVFSGVHVKISFYQLFSGGGLWLKLIWGHTHIYR